MIVKSWLSSLFYLAFLWFWKPICIIPEKRSCRLLSMLLKLICRAQNLFVPLLKELIGSVPIGEGLGDVAQWRGWTPLSTSVCDSVSVFSAWQLFISLVFHSCSEHLIFVNIVPLINLLHAFFLQQTFKALRLRSYGSHRA